MLSIHVVPPDNVISVNGIGFDFPEPFPHEENLTHLSWFGSPDDGYGQMDFSDDYSMKLLPPLFEEEVAPYLALWQGEKARRDKLAQQQEFETQQFLNSTEYKLRTLRDMRQERLNLYDTTISQLDRMQRLATTDEMKAEIAELRHKWDAYAEKLCNLTDHPDCPWDGGNSVGEPNSIPWPEEPPTPKSISE